MLKEIHPAFLVLVPLAGRILALHKRWQNRCRLRWSQNWSTRNSGDDLWSDSRNLSWSSVCIGRLYRNPCSCGDCWSGPLYEVALVP